MSRSTARFLLLAAVTVAALVTAVWAFLSGSDSSRFRGSPATATAPVSRAPNMLLIVIDTLRADRMGAYANPRGNSENLDAIAAEGVTFERAIAQSPWTQPSMASLFCSRYPSVHQVLDYRKAFNATFKGAEKVAVFNDSFVTLAEALRENGYVTSGFVANSFLLREYGFAQGFEHFDSTFADSRTPGSVVNDSAMSWLGRHDSGKPFFVYLHYMDVHGPYNAGPQFLDSLLDEVEQLPEKRKLTNDQIRRLGYLRELADFHTNPARHERLSQYREYWEARYDAGIRQVDFHVGNLRARLEDAGLWDDTLVIVTSDHGEELCEHDLWEHGLSVHHTELHVPLIVYWKGRVSAGKRISETVRLIDLMPTLLDWLAFPAVIGVQGESILPHLNGTPPPQPAPAFAEGIKWGPEQRAVYLGPWKMIMTVSTGQRQLYNLTHDPLEQLEISLQNPDKIQRLTQVLEEQVGINRVLASNIEPEAVNVSPEQQERLRALGYVK